MNINKLMILIGIVIIPLVGCDDIFFEEQPKNHAVGNFESLWQTFDEKYAVFEQRGVDWDLQYEAFRPLLTENSSDEELYSAISGMLSSLDDGHVSLMAPGRAIYSSKEIFRTQEGANLFDLWMLLDEYLNNNYERIADQVFYGMHSNDIGYIFINHLSDPIDIDMILNDLSRAQAIVIDLRHNNGGDFTNGEEVAARFCDERRLAFSGQPKDGPGEDDFGDITEYYLEPAGTIFDGPVALLTSRYTISAGENLTMYLNILPNVTVFGEATAGAMGERIEKEMPNGWIYSITGQIMRASDGISYEGPGLPPDVPFVNRIEDVQNDIDSLFLTAVNHLNNQL